MRTSWRSNVFERLVLSHTTFRRKAKRVLKPFELHFGAALLRYAKGYLANKQKRRMVKKQGEKKDGSV